MLFPRRLTLIALLTMAGTCVSAVAGQTQEWHDHKGATFRAEPVETIGPLALFRTGGTSSRSVPMHVLTPEDCVRFYQAIAARPGRAEHWSEAKGKAARECIGRLQQSEGGHLRAYDFDSVPEPELLLVLCAGRRNPDAAAPFFLLNNLAPFINRVQRVYPGRLATIVSAGRDSHLNLHSLPNSRTWLVANPEKVYDMKVLSRFAPGEGFLIVLMTREGVPLHGGPANNVTDVMRFVDGASEILWELNPANPATARDRLYYLRAVRPVEFAKSSADPALLIDPLRADVLRKRGVMRIDANFDVGADGAVKNVELLPDSEMPAPLAPAVREGLRRAIFLPAIDHGAPVAGTFHYAYVVPTPDPQLAADAAWVNGEARVDVPLKSWLVLKPIHVPEQVFSTIDKVGPDGVLILHAVTASDPKKISKKSQLNSFNNDWFETTGGPGSVQPVPGGKQEVDGDKLTWKRVTPEDGLVDFHGDTDYNRYDYCIGYAWTEFEMPADTDAWLGIGSDDGLKVWVNGDLVDDKWVERQSRLDDDVVGVRLKKGRNAILIKIQNVHGYWSFTARLRVRGTQG